MAFGTLGLLTLNILGCESKEDANISKAQSCLDGATSSNASQCLSHISGIESAYAYKIRCSVGFLEQGFNSARFADAFRKLSEKSATNSSVTAIAFMVFKDINAVPAKDFAQNVNALCLKSLSPGLKTLSSLTLTATTAASLLGNLTTINNAIADGNLDPTEINNIKAGFDPATISGDPQKKEEIGSTILNLNDTMCGTNSAQKDTDVCKKVASAISTGGGTPAGVADEFLKLLKNSQ